MKWDNDPHRTLKWFIVDAIRDNLPEKEASQISIKQLIDAIDNMIKELLKYVKTPSLGIDMSNDKFFYKGKFFQNEDEFWKYANDWPFMNTDQETFYREWDHLGKEIWMNIGLRGQEISNGALNEILGENFIFLLQKFFGKDSSTYFRECKNE